MHWEKTGAVVDETVPLFEQAAKGPEGAADDIEDINDAIQGGRAGHGREAHGSGPSGSGA
ncbi:hypothetical protein [Streptomyces sp. CRN 30]|uniref:hypothetical protein n=1 Tax=Streptomyces sp. CRN 30 TaxID=3075613 RepID=UPI002A836047|nr:hypothetical protein [Streptomyces sp. CRN 30]